MMEETITLLSDRNIQAYFLVLGLAIHQCIKLYYYGHSTGTKSTKNTYSNSIINNKPSIIPPLLSLSILSITWYLILHFIVLNLQSSTSYFDDAYKDVLRDGHYFTSTQLLTWAIVAVVWVEDVMSWNGVAFLLFGFLGAMGSSFVIWISLDLDRKSSVDGRRKRVGFLGANHESTVPITYTVTSIIAFVSILRLQPCDPNGMGECTPEEGFGTFHIHFRSWLQCLHIILIAPIMSSLVLPEKLLPRFPSCLLFGALALACAGWHIHQIKEGAKFAFPRTDCQLSITTDLISCSCITLYAIYRDAMRSGKLNRLEDDVAMFHAWKRMCVAAIIMPLVSPAAVLAGHLCLSRFGAMYTSFIARMQQRVASKLGTGEEEENIWCNLGLWTSDDCSYNQACSNLACALGKIANLNSSDALLSCGCGSIEEVRYFKQEFTLRHATGIDPFLPEARRTLAADYNVRTIRASVEDLAVQESGCSLFPPRLFNKILALDNIYHYRSKKWFFRDCFEMLPRGGVVAVSDIVLRQSSKETPFWVKMTLRLMGVVANELWSIDKYKQNLESIGYSHDVKIELVGKDVFKRWSFLPECLLHYIDYALIAAKKAGVKKYPTKKRIAIIGSGLAGLSTAHYLLSSPDAAGYDVDIYEANENGPGLAGNTHLLGRQLVDVPARMACLGYYNEYKQLIDDLGIPYTVVRTDSSFYGDDGHGSEVCYSYDRNSLTNIYNAIFIGGIRKLWKIMRVLSALHHRNESQKQMSFGEWLQVNLDLPRDEQHGILSLTCRDNPFVYVMVGSLAWMLSCTWTDLLEYPADIVLPYCRGLKMNRLGLGRQGQVVRIVPSIKVLERTLLYGVSSLTLGSRVSAIDNSKVINGVSYDAVVVATEAKAVPKVLKNSADVFAKITYHPSTIYLHTDESFMPRNKKDWRCWNVEMSSNRKEPQLTFWLNEFYPGSHFDTNVFQTWAPSHSPKEGTIIKRSDFERVVHSKYTRPYIDAIESIQGKVRLPSALTIYYTMLVMFTVSVKDNIYFAGSYCQYGMGLLEEALKSGKYVSDKINHKFSITTQVTTLPTTLTALVVGAGPSGLVTAKYLLDSKDPKYNVTIVEQSNNIGGSFVNKVYDNTRLVSSKYLTAFSDFRMPEECPDHPSAEQYVKYLESYANKFELREHIKFGCRVVTLKNTSKDAYKGDDNKGYDVQYQFSDGHIESKHYDVVAVCSGLHNVPYIPALFTSNCGLVNKFKGEIMHSSLYKNSSIFANKRVLILGSGETAMDLAHRAVLHPACKSVALSVRNGFLSIPHNLAKDRPLDVFITNLFEHAYEHPWVHHLRLRWILSSIFIRLFLLLTGSSFGFNQWAVETTPVRRGYHIINKNHAAMSHLNVPMKQKSAWGRFWLWVYNEENLRPIQTFHRTQVVAIEDDGETVKFCDGQAYRADLIVLCTGYKQCFPFLHREIQQDFRDESIGNNTGMSIDEDYLPCEHFIVGKSRPRLGFIGFVRPNVGAIPPMSELQVMWWMQKMKGRMQMLKRTEQTYMVLGKKYAYGVDYGNYMHRVAEDFGAAPTLSRLASSSNPFKALYTYCIGQSMISLFRLRGPFESNECWDVVIGELWRVCMRRGLAENAGLLIMTYFSLLMNITACFIELLWCIITLKRPQFFTRY